MTSPPKRRLALTITAHGDDWLHAADRISAYVANLALDHMHDPLDEPSETSGATSAGCTHTAVVRPDALTGVAYDVALLEWAEGDREARRAEREQDDRPTTTRVDLTPSQMASLERVGWVWGSQGLGAWLVARAREASDLRRDLDEAQRAALAAACSSDDLKHAVPLSADHHKPCAACGGNSGWRMAVPAGSVAGLRCERCSTTARYLVRGLDGEVLALPEGAVPTCVREARARREALAEADLEIERLHAQVERLREQRERARRAVMAAWRSGYLAAADDEETGEGIDPAKADIYIDPDCYLDAHDGK